jgi:hypothetical protein
MVTMKKMLITMVAAAVVAAACGQSDADKQADAAGRAADAAGRAADAAGRAADDAGRAADKAADATAKTGAQAANDMAKAMQDVANAFSGGAADGKRVEPIAFQTLQAHLPKVSGWEMEEPEGQRMTMPVPFSQVETEYRKGDSRIELTIVDTGFAQMLIAPWSMMLATGFANETSSGHQKAVTIAGYPAFEEWRSRDKDGTLNILVGKRYMVSIDGSNVADMKELHQFASALDLGAIANLK